MNKKCLVELDAESHGGVGVVGCERQRVGGCDDYTPHTHFPSLDFDTLHYIISLRVCELKDKLSCLPPDQSGGMYEEMLRDVLNTNHRLLNILLGCYTPEIRIDYDAD